MAFIQCTTISCWTKDPDIISADYQKSSQKSLHNQGRQTTLGFKVSLTVKSTHAQLTATHKLQTCRIQPVHEIPKHLRATCRPCLFKSHLKKKGCKKPIPTHLKVFCGIPVIWAQKMRCKGVPTTMQNQTSLWTFSASNPWCFFAAPTAKKTWHICSTTEDNTRTGDK